MGSPILGSSHIFLFAHDNFTQSRIFYINIDKVDEKYFGSP